MVAGKLAKYTGTSVLAEKQVFKGHPDGESEQPFLLGIIEQKKRKVRGVFGPGTAGKWIWAHSGPWRPHDYSAPPPWPIQTAR